MQNAFFDFTLDETSVGAALEPADGFTVNLRMSVPPNPEQVAWHPLERIHTAAFFTLRGEGDGGLPFALRNLISYNASANPLAAWGDIWRNASVPYKGKLLVESVPRGSQWSLRLSDQPNPRAAPKDPAWWTDAMKASATRRVETMREPAI